MDIIALAYIGPESTNLDEWSRYAPEVLGMQVRPHDGDALLLRMDERHHRIAIRPGEAERLSYVGWELRDRPAFEDALRILDAEGLSYTVGDEELCAERGVHAVAYLDGPDRIRHELFYGQAFASHSFVPGAGPLGLRRGRRGLWPRGPHRSRVERRAEPLRRGRPRLPLVRVGW
ncbi:hypothetical protein LP422_02990 [Janibacter limosus]|uniref:Uncharacterized protein n=1 Tax=Janibacter limosus TaxID=53458 RepID=A0AC61U5B9_9MICO|nr:hypothetical protein [Janibacter limosus]UUZ45241.1 hypothetical protein LP422_02990 [Janibacter limosus]